jgi:hypothetical protein
MAPGWRIEQQAQALSLGGDAGGSATIGTI